MAQLRKGCSAIEHLINETLKTETKRSKNIEKFSESSITLSLKFKNFIEDCNKNIEKSRLVAEDLR